MGYFSPVDQRLKFKKQSKNGGTETEYRSFVDPCYFIYGANLHTSEVETHTRQKLYHFGRYDGKARLF